MLQTGELVIYGAQGVCRVEGLEKMKVGTSRREYYVLKPLMRGSATVYVPADNDELRLKMRRLLSREELDALIAEVTSEPPVWQEDNNLRKAEFQRVIAEGERGGLMRMIRAIYLHRQELKTRNKRLRSTDEQFLRDAERLLNDEFATVLGIAPQEVPQYIQKSLEIGA